MGSAKRRIPNMRCLRGAAHGSARTCARLLFTATDRTAACRKSDRRRDDLNPRSSITSSRRCRIGKRETMKSAFFATIFVIVGGVAILLAVPAEEKAPVIKIQPPKSFPDYGDPVVPQIEEVPPQEVVVPEPLGHYYSVAQAKTEKPATRHHTHIVRPQPNFFEKLVAGFIKLQ